MALPEMCHVKHDYLQPESSTETKILDPLDAM